jgi:hypothetical protein
MRLVAFCEARADFVLLSTLVDRVLRAQAVWIADLLDTHPDGIRSWIDDGRGHAFFHIHKMREYAVRILPRVPQGHFDGRPGAAGATMARTAFAIVRAMNRSSTTAVDGVVLMWDMDGDATDRRAGLEQARAKAQTLMQCQIVLGCPDRMREAWVLAGFDPRSSNEQERLENEKEHLGFPPNIYAHRLTAANEHEERSAKRVLRVLTDGEWEREEQCWTDADLETLRTRGVGSGLTEFLDEIKQRVVPFCGVHVPR